MRPARHHLRLLCQALTLGLFVATFCCLPVASVRGEVASSLLALDPLTTLGTALADWTVPRWSWMALVVLAATAVCGRFFCGWICPLGTLQHLASWLAGPDQRRRLQRNRYRRWFAAKYLVLAAVLTWSALGAQHCGWLDPIALLHRGVAAGVQPLYRGVASPAGWIAFGLLAAILLLSVWMPRLYCRAVCPLGALFGLFARHAPLRLYRRSDGEECSGCSRCLIACQGADEPLTRHRPAECHLCFNCTAACGEGRLGYGLVPAKAPLAPPLDVGRRRFLLTVAGSAVMAPVLRVAGGGFAARAHDAIRPPGALAEEAFLARCLTCGACVAACPTGALVADVGRTGIEGLFSPVLVPRRGWCEPSCTRCGEVCPSAALTRLPAEAKQAIGGPAEVKIGTAFIDHDRCLPWVMDRPCIVCEEMCPTSPKAIRLERVVVVRSGGANGIEVELQRPHLDPELCTGCGLCENRCPVGELAAIRISSIGETRDPDNRLLQVEIPKA